jgi:prepilin-type N-terminal cleavage/methylation domain-containing protein
MRELRRRRDRGITLVEVAVVLMVIAVASLFAVPYLQSARILANEEDAARVLRAVADSQKEFRRRNGDRTYGLLPELMGEPLRRGIVAETRLLNFPGLKRVDAAFVQYKGYQFAVYLPTAKGGTWMSRGVDSRKAAQSFIAYGWPVNLGYSGRMIFAIDETGQLRRHADERGREVRGEGFPPAPNFAPHASDAFGPPPPEQRAAIWEPVRDE